MINISIAAGVSKDVLYCAELVLAHFNSVAATGEMAFPNLGELFLWSSLLETFGSKSGFLRLGKLLGFLIHWETIRDNKLFENLLHEGSDDFI